MARYVANRFFGLRVAWLLLAILGTASLGESAAPDWSVTAGPAMNTARMGHLSTVLPDGGIAVFGGHGEGFTALDSAEIWDAASASFQVSLMNQDHDLPALARLADGRYLVAGGAGDLGVSPGLDAAEIFDPTTGIFSLTGSMSRPRMNAWAATLPSGRVLIVGGWYDASSATYGEVYNPATGTFSATGPLNTPRALPMVLPTDDGKAVVFGGIAPYGSPMLEVVELYDLTGNSFNLQQTSLFPAESGWHIAASNYAPPQRLADGRYLLMAHRDMGETYEYTLFTFDPATKSFARLETSPALPTSQSLRLWPPLLDEAAGVAYLLADTKDSGEQTVINLLVIDLADWSWDVPDTSYQLPANWYLGGMAAVVLPNGNLFMSGGHSGTGSEANFTPINQTLLASIDVDRCTYSIAPEQQAFAAEGGSAVLTVTASAPSCAWTAVSNASWLTVTAGLSGSGDGTVSYRVAAHSSTTSRSATLTVAGRTLAVTQAAAEEGQDPPSGGYEPLTGTSGNDLLTAEPRNMVIDGLAGVDTLALPSFPDAYAFTQSGDREFTAQHQNYTLVIRNVEYVRFGSHYLTRLPVSAMTSGQVQADLVKLTDLYLAFFGRAPDVPGLEYWMNLLLEGTRDFTRITKDFAWSTEAQGLYPTGESSRDFVRTVYNNCFERDPDAAGWDYWTAKLDSLDPSHPEYLNDRGLFVGELLLGAYAVTSGPEDRAFLSNRHDVALSYVNRLSIQPEEGFDPAINALLSRVVMDPDSREGAEQVLDYVFATVRTLGDVMADAELLTQLWAVDVAIDWQADARQVVARVVLPESAPLNMSEVEVSTVFSTSTPDAEGNLVLPVPDSFLTDATVVVPLPDSEDYAVYFLSTILPGETSVEFSAEATAVNLILNGIDRIYLTGDLAPAEVRGTIRDSSTAFIASFVAALAADPYYLRSDNLENVYDASFDAALAASQAALAQAQPAVASRAQAQPAAVSTDSEGLTVKPAREIQDFRIMPARQGLTGYGDMDGDLLIQNDSMLPARYQQVDLFTNQVLHTPPTGVFGDIIGPQASLIYGFNAGTSKVTDNHFRASALTLYTPGWAFYSDNDSAVEDYVKGMNRVLNQRLLLDNIITILSNLVPVSDASFYKAWLQWLGDQGFFQAAMDKFYVEQDLQGAVDSFLNGMLNWDNLKGTLKFVARYYGQKSGVELLKIKAKWLFKITTLKAKIWIYAGDLTATELDLFSTSPVIEFTEVHFPLYLKNYGPSGLSKVSTIDDNRRVTLFGQGLNAFGFEGATHEPTVFLQAYDTEGSLRNDYVEGEDIHSAGADSIWFDLPFDWVNSGSEIVGPIYFQLRHAFVDPYLSDSVIEDVRLPADQWDLSPYYQIELLSDLQITGVSKDPVTRGEELTIYGSGFAPLMAENHVYFTDNEDVEHQGNVTYATDSTLEVTVPDSLPHGPTWIDVELDDGTLSNAWRIAVVPKAVHAQPDDGTDFAETLQVSLSQTENVPIFYSIGSGSEQRYSGPILLTDSATIHARAKVTVENSDYASGYTSFVYYRCSANQVLVDGVCVDKVAPPTASPTAQEFVGSVGVSLSQADGYTIQYQVGDGPWRTYAGPITLTDTATISAYAVDPGGQNSDVVSFTYVKTTNNLSGKWLLTEKISIVSDGCTEPDPCSESSYAYAEGSWSYSIHSTNAPGCAALEWSDSGSGTHLIPPNILTPGESLTLSVTHEGDFNTILSTAIFNKEGFSVDPQTGYLTYTYYSDVGDAFGNDTGMDKRTAEVTVPYASSEDRLLKIRGGKTMGCSLLTDYIYIMQP